MKNFLINSIKLFAIIFAIGFVFFVNANFSQAADVTIDTGDTAPIAGMNAPRSIVWTSATVGYFFYIDSDNDFTYAKTTDGGQSWANHIVDINSVDNTTTALTFDVWYDKWTPGDNGTTIHIWWSDIDTDDIFYRALDTNGDSFGTMRTAFAHTAAASNRANFISGTKSRGGNLYFVGTIDAGTVCEFGRSTDGGTTWDVTRATPQEVCGDQGILFPANLADANDIWMLYDDISAELLTLKTNDDSADSWAESGTTIPFTDETTLGTGEGGYSGSIRHSDGHLIAATHSQYDNAATDFRVWDITDGSTITEKTAITTDKDDNYYSSVYIDQSTNDIYVSYTGKRDGTQTLGTTVGIYYTKSTDGGANWTAGDTTYSESTGNFRQNWAGMMGDRFGVVYRNDGTEDLAFNYVNSLDKTPPATRYWRGGSATWDATAGSKWAYTSGGPTGAPVPTASDAVFFDATSGNVTVTTSGTTTDVAKSIDFTGFTGTFNHAAGTEVNIGTSTSGNLTLASGMTYTIGNTETSVLDFVSTTTGNQITTNGKIIPTLNFGTSGGSWTFQDATTISGTMTISNGTVATGANLITFTGTGTPFVYSGGTFTPTSGGTVLYTGNGATVKSTTYHHLRLEPSSSSQQVLTSGALIVNGNLTIGDGTSGHNGATAATNTPAITVTGTTTIAANATFTPGATAASTITLVQQTSSAIGGTPLDIVLGSSVTAGNALILTYGVNNTGSNITDVSGGGVTWVKAKAQNNTGSRSEIWYGINSSGASGTITVTLNQANTGRLHLAEFSGVALDGATVLDQINGATGATSSLISGSITTTNANDLIIGSVGTASASRTCASNCPGGGFTDFGTSTGVNFAAYRIVTSTGTYQASWTADAAVNFAGAIAGFKSGYATTTFTGLVTVNGTLSGSADSSITANGGITVGGAGTINLTGGTVTMGTGTLSNGNNATFYNLTVADSATLTANTSYTVKNNLTIGTGATLAPTSGTITLENDFTNNGTFTGSGSNTVSLTTSATADIGGTNSATFYNFSATGIGAAKIIKFKHHTADVPLYTFNGTLTLTGASSQLITITSDDGANPWLAHFAAGQTVSYVDVSYSTCDGTSHADGVVVDANSTLGTGNDSCWHMIDNVITISGTTNAADSLTVRVAVNGSLKAQTGTTGTPSPGNWQVTGVSVGSGQAVTVFLTDGDGDIPDANESTAVAKYDGEGDMTGIVLNTNVLSIGSVDNQSLTLADLDLYDCAADEDVMYRVNTYTLEVQGASTCAGTVSNSYANETLQIEAGDTFTLGASGIEILNTDNLTINGTLTVPNASQLNIGGSWDNNFVFNKGTSLAYFSSTTTETIDSTGASTADFNVISFIGTGTWTLGSALALADHLTVGVGTLKNGGYSITGASGKTFSVYDGAFFEMSGASAYPTGFSTYTYDATSTVSYLQTNGATVLAGTYGHLNLKPASSTQLVLGAGTLSIAGNLVIGDGGNNGATATTNSPTISVTGTTTIAAGATFTPGTVSGGGGGASVKIDDASNFGAMLGSSRQVVRTSTGTLYVALNNAGSCEIWKSADGTSWAQQDSANNPACITGTEVALAVDSSNVLHILYKKTTGNPTEIWYVTFTTSSDTFGTAELAISASGLGAAQSSYDVAVDSANKPHMVVKNGPNTGRQLLYLNRISGTWSSAVSLWDIAGDGGCALLCEFSSIIIDNNDKPEVSFISGTNSLFASIGNANNATSFARQSLDTTPNVTAGQLGTSIGMDSSGNTWVAYVDENGSNDLVTLAKHNGADAWSTGWTLYTKGNVGSEPSIAINGTDIYVFYKDINADVAYDLFDSNTWTIITPASVKIDDAGDPGTLPGAGRQVVRTSGGTLYSFINDGGSCEIWKSADGSSWTEQDTADNPTCDSGSNDVAMAIDSTDVLHLLYFPSSGTTFGYMTFATSTDQFGTEETQSLPGTIRDELDIAVDSNNKPHVVINNTIFTDAASIFYSNRVGGSWKVLVTLESSLVDSYLSVSITISEDNIPEISYINVSALDLTAAVGNVNDAASFALHDVDTSINVTAGQMGTSIGVDSSGNTWISYVDENGASDFVTLVKHNDADAWTTWQTPVTNSNVGSEPSIAINGTDVFVFYEDDLDDVVYDMYNGSTWFGQTTLQTGTFQDVKAKWAFLNNTYGSKQIDYLYSNGTDVFWDTLPLTLNTATEVLQIGIFQDVKTKWSFLNNNGGSTQIDYLYSDGTDVYWNKLVFDSSTGGETFTGLVTVNGTLSGSGDSSITANGGITVGGSGTINLTGGTVTMGTGTLSNSNAATFYNLTVADSATLTANTSYTVKNNLTIGTGATLSPTSGTITLENDFTNNGTFTGSGSNTVVLNTTNTASVIGDTSFYNFTVATDNKRVLFQAGDTFTINGLLTLTASAYNQKIFIDATEGHNAQWYIKHLGTESIAFVDLEDAGCDPASTDISMGTTSNDSSHNDHDCWIFTVSSRGGSGGNAGGESDATPDSPAGGGGPGGGGGNAGGESGGNPGEPTQGGGSGGGGGDSGFLFDSRMMLASVFEAFFMVFRLR